MDSDGEPECHRDVDTPEEESEEINHQGGSPGVDQDPEIQFHPRHSGMGARGGPGMEPIPPPYEMSGMPGRMNPDPYDGTGDWEEYQAYFEQMAMMHGWNRATMAMVLGVSLRGAARNVLTGLTLVQKRDYKSIVQALKQNFSPAQKVHTYLAELRSRKRKPNEPWLVWGETLLA